MEEAELLAQVAAIFQRAPKANLVVPNGDDGAVFTAQNQVIACSDVANEDVHFKLEWSSYFEIGRKITAANLADICAMGGWPEFLLVTVTLGKRHLSGILDLAEGIAAEADLVGAQVIGGDISSGEKLSISMTALGQTSRPILRSGARVGDQVFISHLPGLSAAGLSLLKSGGENTLELERRAIAQHKAPKIEYEKYRGAYKYLNSAIDVSDGLIRDAGHIASASGVKIEISSAALRESELKSLAPEGFLDWIFSGGEDHALLGTASESVPGFIAIGSVVEGSGVSVDGANLEAGGWSHSWSGTSERPFQP